MMEIELTLTGQVSALHEWVGGTSPWRVAYVALSTCVCVCVCVLSHWAHEAVHEVPDLLPSNVHLIGPSALLAPNAHFTSRGA